MLVVISFVLVALLAGCPDPVQGPTVSQPGTMAAPTLEVGNGQLRANWTPPKNNGGSEITAYELRHSDDGGSNWSGLVEIPAPATSIAITNLTNLTEYIVQARARNSAGAGDWSGSSDGATPNSIVPTEPNNFMLAVSLQTITATWTAPTDTGDSAITHYELQYRVVGTSAWESVIATADADTLTITTPNLTKGAEYEVQVYAVNGQGNGNSATGTATPVGPPYAPNAPTLTVGNAQLTATWTAPDDGGSAITGYDVQYSSDSGSHWTPAPGNPISGTSYTIPSLVSGTTYDVRVRAVNAQGNGDWSVSAALTFPIKPSAPNAPTLTGGNAQITATWTAPDNGGSTITAYHVQHRTSAAGTWSTTDTDNIAAINDGTTSSTITGLTNGDSYQVRARAVNAIGTGGWSAPATGTTIISAAQTTPAGTAATVNLSAAARTIITAQSPTVALTVVEPGTLAVSGSGVITVTAATAPAGVAVPTINASTGVVTVAASTTAGTYLVYGTASGGTDILFAEYFSVTVSPTTNAELDTQVAAGISNWGNTANLNYIITTAVTDMSNVFRGSFEATNRFNGDISGWDVSKVTTMHYMFYGATVFNGDISGWDVSKVTTMENMFYGAFAFNGDISRWDTGAVTTMYQMFYTAKVFNGDISNWDVSSVTNMFGMFSLTDAFNQNISGWNVSKVTDMRNMFNQADIFNQDLENWKDHWSTAAGTLNAAGKYTRNKTNMFVDSGLDANPAVGDDSGDQPNYPSWY
ncbi:MAG: BspA family leucine-rich repeat surface protein [Salinispira sp.]